MLEAIIICSSIAFGSILHIVAKEEIKTSKKYIIFARTVLIILTATLLIYADFNPIMILSLLFGFTLFLFLKNLYLIIGAATFLSLSSQNMVLILSSILLLTLVHSSLSAPSKKMFIRNSLYFILPFSLVLIETFIKGNLDIFTGFIAGGLLAQLKGP